MKLLYCKNCRDVVRLIKENRYCLCGKSSGMYLDNVNAVYSGNAVPLGINNSSFNEAVFYQKEKESITFDAFVIEKQCKTFIKK